MRYSIIIAAVVLMGLLVPGVLYPGSGDRPPRVYTKEKVFNVTPAVSKITVDGILDEKAWEKTLTLELTNEISPGENIPPPVKTQCLVTYDNTHFYVAFRAYDPQPDKIRAHLGDRDKVWQDDLVAIVLDTFNDNNRAFGFFVNPLGIQIDEIWSNGGSSFDGSWDAIWKSAGRITDFGYVVEIAIPFQAIQFQPSSEKKTWGFVPLRVYSRSQRNNISLFHHNRSQECMICQFPRLTGFKDISGGKKFELDPTVTGFRTNQREDFPAGPLAKSEEKYEVGISGRWAFTSNLTFSGALNPDFSQVEADAAQLDVNTQFALYYEEKRPFFLEGIDFFKTHTDAVYTRTVADPQWGIKLSGKEGKNAFGLFVTRDRITNLLFPGAESSYSTSLDQGCFSSVLRYRRDIGSSSTLGVLVTDREGDDYHNRLAGVDGLLRISKSDIISFQVLGSSTAYPEAEAGAFGQDTGTIYGSALNLSYTRAKRSYSWKVIYNDFSPSFRADLGFIPQVDYRKLTVGAGYTWWGKKESFFTRINIEGDLAQTLDHDGNLLEKKAEANCIFEGPLQSLLLVNAGARKLVFSGIPFNQVYSSMLFQIKPTGTLEFYTFLVLGDELDYDHARAGKILNVIPEIVFHLGKHFKLSLSYSYSRLQVEGKRLFLARLPQGYLEYHFSKKLFFRGILQYTDIKRNPDLYSYEVDPRFKKLFTQLLLSYKLNPRTVLFLGYTDNFLGFNHIGLTRSSNTFFAKVGYALPF